MRSTRLEQWEPEDATFWETKGKSIAYRNLAISVPCLLCAFAVWSYWSIITVQMKNLGFAFTAEQLFTLSAVAGLTGATLRIPSSFLLSLAGGRNVVAVETLLLLIPAIGTGVALQDKSTRFETFVILAALSGFGGGNFATSMANISTFFPKRMQGMALGVNAGFGNLGVSVMQLLLPLVMTFPLFGTLGGEGLPLASAVGGRSAGTLVWIQNCGLVWVPILVTLGLAAWWGMNVLPTHNVGSTALAVLRVLGLNLVGLAGAGAGLGLLMNLGVSMWVALPLAILVTLLVLRFVPGGIAQSMQQQFAIFGMKHTWSMTWLYVMTFGSFIGYSMAFPLLIRVVFGTLPDGSPNPNAPNPFAYAWLGPLVGSLIRPVGGWLADKWGGARVTQWSTAVMVMGALGVAHFIKRAGQLNDPGSVFLPFLILFLVLFTMAGIGNGSTFRMIPILFDRTRAGAVLGWTSAVGAYGAFIIPKVIGGQIQAHRPEFALYGFAAYYVSCLFLNWWLYARRGAEAPC